MTGKEKNLFSMVTQFIVDNVLCSSLSPCMNFEKKGNNWNESPPGISAMTGKENRLFSMVTQFSIKLKTRIVLQPVYYGLFFTVIGAGFDALWVCDAGMRTRSVPYYVMIYSN